MPPPQVAVSHSSFFPTSFHDLLCPLLPTVSPVWNTFSSHPTGFKPPVIPTDFRPEHNKPRAAFCAQLYIFFFFQLYISALGVVRLPPAWSFPSSSIQPVFEFIWVFGVFCFNRLCDTAVCLEQRKCLKAQVSVFSPAFLLCSGFSHLVAIAQGGVVSAPPLGPVDAGIYPGVSW